MKKLDQIYNNRSSLLKHGKYDSLAHIKKTKDQVYIN